MLPRVGVVERAYCDWIGTKEAGTTSAGAKRRLAYLSPTTYNSRVIIVCTRSLADLLKEASPGCHVPGIVSSVSVLTRESGRSLSAKLE